MVKSIGIVVAFVLSLIGIIFITGQKSADNDPARLQLAPAQLMVTALGFIANHEPIDRMSFCGEAVPMTDLDVFERYEREFLVVVNDRTQVALYLKRAGRYFPYIEKRLKEAGIPDDIKYLVVAESALLNVSSSAGAAGFWQIMPKVATEYGLEVSTSIDERYNLEKSTTAAIKYLNEAHRRFGSWTLAATSYNMGMYGTSDELQFQNRQSYYDLWLNSQTSRYVFRILSIKEVMERTATYGYAEVKPYPEIETRQITVKEAIPNLAEWAIQQGVSYKIIKLFNPWIRSRQLPAPSKLVGEYKILLPKDADGFKSTATYSYGANTRQDKAIVDGYYIVSIGETLQSIANKCGLTVEELRLQNKIKEDDELKPGMKLKISPR
ncbi:MAG: transglycosylase SLT domain-containing protein [Chlorobiales bacterium]|nr:transglycosylase SLT domain-containing protein [Chlorobiales bacterium]